MGNSFISVSLHTERHQFPAGICVAEVLRGVSATELPVLAVAVDGQVQDLAFQLTSDSTIELLSWDTTQGKSTFWHSSAHLLAEALESLYPGVKFGTGPSTENGFYYDVDLDGHTISQEDFPKIEAKMLKLADQKNEYIREPISKVDALEYFIKKGDEYKLELVDGLEDGSITLYKQGGFTDLCRGPHIPNTGLIKAVKLTNIAGAYWRNNKENKMLTRIYGITFPTQKELEEYITLMEEAKKRDHRRLGKELGLFAFSERVGQGLPLWLPKGAMLRERLQGFLNKVQTRAGYMPVISPHIGSKDLYVTSGHWDKYGKDSFQPIKTPNPGEEYMLKPMNCPHHCEIYKTAPRSYKDLPLRFSEFGTVYRYEQSGELHGLTRVRGFTQDDAHIFCRPDQVKEEFIRVIDLVLYVFKSLGFNDYSAQISLRDPHKKEKYIGNDEDWEKAESAIIEAAGERGLITVTELGEAAFYGPKLDFMVRDALGRKWQLGTIQVDYQLPQRFQLEYTGSDNQKHRPVMVHRAPFGSMERFIAILIENTGGQFPLWLSPDQIAILPISEKFANYAERVFFQLQDHDIRGFVDHRDEKIGRKIRDAEVTKVPFMLIVGEREATSQTISVRTTDAKNSGFFTVDQFIELFKNKLIRSV